MSAEIGKYRSFLEETLRPDYLKTIEKRDIILDEKSEYEILLISIRKIIVSVVSYRVKVYLFLATNTTSVKTRVNIGHHIFVNAETNDCKKIIVKMMDNLFVELPLERAVSYIESRIKLLDDRASQFDMVASKVRAHIDIVLTSLNDYQELAKDGNVQP